MPFNRPPRIQAYIPEDEVIIPSPKALPTRPRIDWISVVLPLVGVGIAAGLMASLYGSSTGLTLIYFLPMMLASFLATIISNWQARKEYDKQVVDELKDYENLIHGKRNDLSEKTKNQLTILNETDPTIQTIIKKAKEQDIHIGERRPNDDDFLTFRIGHGRRKSFVNIKPPSEDGWDEKFSELFNQAKSLKLEYEYFDDAPITLRLPQYGCVGASGSRTECREFVRACIAHLSFHHWPKEVNFAVFTNSTKASSDWNWIINLPHSRDFLDTPVVEIGNGTKQIIDDLETEIHRREALIYQDKTLGNDKGQIHLPAIVIILDNIVDIYEYPAFALILKKSKEIGIYALVLTESYDMIPGECGATLELNNRTIDFKETGEGKTPSKGISADPMSLAEATDFATSLDGIPWLFPQIVTDPPSETISLLDIFGAVDIEDIDIAKSWDGEYLYKYLRSPIGKFTPTADMIFDLNENSDDGETHGPHGIIGGMTGSGKSELLRTLILSFAITHHPYDINFALIDYKGGGAFKDLEKLPHVVGVITDIETHGNYANRVIQALSGEINTRKQILMETQKINGITRPHIDDYRLLDVKRPLPRLIIIFDEFAEFRDQHPDESKKLINIARQGRSLGVHLILCTQNPATAVDQEVKQNSKFAISLSVNSPDDSRSLIGIPDAFGLQPGLAYIYVKSPQKFKVAFTGAEIKSGKYKGKTVAQAVVEHIIDVSRSIGLPNPPHVWPNTLPDRLYLPRIYKSLEDSGISIPWDGNSWQEKLSGMSHGFILGLFDDPFHQRQPIYYFGNKEGPQHLLVFGASQSGKSTLLLTLAIGIATQFKPSDANIYCLDLGGQSLLYKLKNMPHLPEEGGVIASTDHERVNRLFGLLRTVIKRRKVLFQGSIDIDDYNLNEHNKKEPKIFLLIDGLNTRFTDSMDGFNDQLSDLLLEGPSVGIHVIITANIPQDVNTKIISYIPEQLILRPAKKREVDNIIENAPQHLTQLIFSSTLPPGRGLLGNSMLEFQTALPVDGINDREQIFYLDQLITKMAIAWKGFPRPDSVFVLERFIYLERYKVEINKNKSIEQVTMPEVILAQSRETMLPVGYSLLNDGPSFSIISGSSRQGKSSLIRLWLTELMCNQPPSMLDVMLIDFHTHSLRHLLRTPHAKVRSVSSQQQFEPSLVKLRETLLKRSDGWNDLYAKDPENFSQTEFLNRFGFILLVIDDYNSFKSKCTPNETTLLMDCLSIGFDYGLRLIVAEKAGLLDPFGDDLIKRIAKDGYCISFGGPDVVEGIYNQITIPPNQKTKDMPLGRGYFICRGEAQLVQFVTQWPAGSKSSEELVFTSKRVDEICDLYPGV